MKGLQSSREPVEELDGLLQQISRNADFLPLGNGHVPVRRDFSQEVPEDESFLQAPSSRSLKVTSGTPIVRATLTLFGEQHFKLSR